MGNLVLKPEVNTESMDPLLDKDTLENMKKNYSTGLQVSYLQVLHKSITQFCPSMLTVNALCTLFNKLICRFVKYSRHAFQLVSSSVYLILFLISLSLTLIMTKKTIV